MGRRPCCEKVGLNRGGWSAVEDEILSNYIKANGEGKWRELPKNAGLKRCGKSCRLRWLNYLDPKIIRGNITQEEEDLIVKLHKHVGNRWSLIAGIMPGRTDNEIKNYWNTILCRKVHGLQVVPKRKPRKRTHEKKSSSNSVPNRRATVLPTLILNANSVAKRTAIDLPNTDAETMQNMVNTEAPQSVVYEECESQQQLFTFQENIADFMGDIMQNLANIEVSQGHIFAECYPLLELVFSQEKSTELLNGITPNISSTEALQCHANKGISCPEIMGDIAHNMASMGGIRQELVSPQERNTEFMGDIRQQGDVYEQCCTQQSGSSQGDSMEVMDEIMQHIINIETPQIYHNNIFYPQPEQEPASSQGDSTAFTGGIMQNIINTESPQSDVYGKCFNELMSDAGTSQSCVQDLDEYVVCTFQDILSEFTFL